MISLEWNLKGLKLKIFKQQKAVRGESMEMSACVSVAGAPCWLVAGRGSLF